MTVYSFKSGAAVEAYVASWIEIMILTKQSRLRVVEAYVASWIEFNMDLGGNVDFLGRSFSGFVD